MNEEQRKKVMETATWEELTQKGLTNNVEFGYYYEALVLRSIRGLKQAAILEVLNTIYKKVQHQQDKNEFAKNVFLFYEQNPNGYKLSDTHRQIISEWAETESEQPQQENELPERVRKGLEYPKLISVFISPDKAREFLIYCEKYCGTNEKSKIPRQAMALVKQNIISVANVNRVLHTLLLEIGFSEEEIGNYKAWRKATLRAR